MRRTYPNIMKSKRLLSLNVVLAVFFLNNWLLGFFLNRTLFNHWGTISELSAAGQPYSWVFRAFDVISGLLLVFLALQLTAHIKTKYWTGKFLVAFVAVLGVANTADALLPLRCAQSLQGACGDAVNLSFSNLQLPSHLYTSTAIVTSFFLLPLLGFLYAKKHEMRLLLASSALTFLILAITLGMGAKEYFTSVGRLGPAQWLQMLIVGWWFVMFRLSLSRAAYNEEY